MTAPTLEIRRAVPEDRPAVLGLMQASLGWRPDGPERALFAWKHEQSPFGPSPSWVAVDGEQVVGFRTFMRWRFRSGDRVVEAVRAVDTATHPDHQGRGIFKALTLGALGELRDEGVDLVFNTPNDQSRPGYLKMGWQVVGRLPVAMTPRGPASLLRTLRARVPAELLSVSTAVGQPVAELLVPDRAGHVPGLRTERSAEFLRWRYGLPELHYRASACGDGAVVFRLRRRGAALELAVCDVLGTSPARAGLHVRRLLRQTGADYAVALRPRPLGTVVLPSMGPLLVWRPLRQTVAPPLAHWDLGLGDVELF